jgi:mannitol-1-/sugar-/sorbitol-6-/2-deoxyglucose-6-phosphatase
MTSNKMAAIPGAFKSFTPAALVLDMDGLMVDSEPLWLEIERAFAAARGGDWTDAHAHAAVGRGLGTTLTMMHEAFGFPVDVARDTALIQDAFVDRVGSLALKPGCLELLDAAAGLPLSVASSSPMRLIRAVLARFAITERFQVIVSGESVANPKPAPDIFLRTAAELGVDPARCAVLEDSLAGATAGHAAGMFVIAVPEGPPGGRGFEAVSSVIVSDLFEARSALQLPLR